MALEETLLLCLKSKKLSVIMLMWWMPRGIQNAYYAPQTLLAYNEQIEKDLPRTSYVSCFSNERSL
ncbi:protein of unknown function [Legionella fallonii LLAP-10]|uniref:Uncharacterized protein n=1 Tax=Legionella fallonii LLAP-10 TaxID=1212491 RepID=A0A098G6C8_9GAMM|nr:protein of unknown function [Legionella fallonii LLAP-10]